MSETLFFSVKTIGLSTRGGRKPQSLLQAAKHNLREDQNERGSRSHIDSTRSHLNQRIAGPGLASQVGSMALAMMVGAGVNVSRLRKDYVQAQELLFSLPADTTLDVEKFFRHCLRWVGEQFDHDNVLTADIHLDESTPHCHVLIAPMAGGVYQGSALIDRARLAKLRESFAKLALTYGLKEPVRRLHGAIRERVGREVLAQLESTQDPILKSALWFTVKTDIVGNPARYAARLGIVLTEAEVPADDGGEAFKRIALSTGRGGKKERTSKPIDFESVVFDGVAKPIGIGNDRENIETIPVLVSLEKAPASTPQKPAPDQSIDDCFVEATTRHHDCDQDPAQFHDGGYCPRSPPAPRRHEQACSAAPSALASQGFTNRATAHFPERTS